MSTIDREELAGAIAFLQDDIDVRPDPPGRPRPRHGYREVVLAAAQAHLATLPKTKMVEHFRVEGWHSLSGPWVACYSTKDAAECTAAAFRKAGAHSCIKVTGPHLQEVPA